MENYNLIRQIREANCSTCPLYRKSKRVEDAGEAPSRVVIVGEAPHVTEIETGIPFTGRSGDLLNAFLEIAGLSREEVYITNAIKCKLLEGIPDSTLTEILRSCRPQLEYTISHIRPDLIIVLGNVALRQVLGKRGILRHRGRFYKSTEFGCSIFVTAHPAYILRACQKEFPDIPYERMNARERQAINDFKLVYDFIHKGTGKALINTSQYTRTTDLKLFMKRSPLAFDLEWDPKTGQPICISLCNAEGFSQVFFFNQFPNKRGLNQLKKLMADTSVKKIVANRPVDENKLLELGIEVKGTVFDVFTMAHLVDENLPVFSLEAIANAYTDLRNIKDLAEGFRGNLLEAQPETVVKYSAVDSDATFRSYQVLKKKLHEDKKVLRYYAHFILPVENMLATISRNGCKIDIKKLRRNEKKAKKLLEELHQELLSEIPNSIKKKYSDNLSLTRPALLIDFLFTSRAGLRLKTKHRTAKTNKPSTKAEHLRPFAAEHDWVKKYFDWKRLQKILTTYLTPMYNYIRADGKIYPSILLYRTVTGRTSIIDPPIQQIPQRGEYRDLILDIFVAEDGWLFGSRDLSQSELRIMGWLAQDPVIMDALKKGIDLHTLTASNVMRIPLDKVTKSDRQKAKPINFGFIYGMQASTFVEYAKDEYGIVYTLKEAEQFREAYFNTYKAIRGFHNYMSRVVSENGFVYTPLGRKRRLPGIHSKDYALRSMAIRQAINTPVQAFSSDLALLGMKLFQDAIESSSTLRGNVKILWFKHDEIFFTAKKEVMNEAMKVLKSCMEHRVKVYIHKHFGLVVDYPIETDGKVGKSWWRLKPVK